MMKNDLKEETPLEEILDEIEESPELVLLFKRLFENATYARLFFLHRDILFLMSENTHIPFLFWNSLDETSKAAESLRVVSTSVEIEEIKKARASGIFGYLFQSFTDVIKDILAFAVIKFVRDNSKVKELINSKDFSFKAMKEALGDYSSLDLKILESDATVDPKMKERLEALTKLMDKGFKDISDELFKSLSDLFPDPLTVYHILGYNHLSRLLQVLMLQKREYLELLTELHSQKIITNFHSIFWCTSCLDTHIILKTKADLSPHHLKMKCPQCGKSMAVSAVFDLDELISDSILSKNGMLGVALAWLLENKQIEYTTEVYNEHEYDFIIKTPSGALAIECKMHRNDNIDERNVRIWLRQDLRQLAKLIREAKKKEITRAVLVYNFETLAYNTIVEELTKRECPEAIVMDYTGLPNYINSLKPT
jgi:hypothetical protein